MHYSLSKYERLVFIKLLGIYLIANCSLPLIEGIHFLLHLGDDTELHSFSAHKKNHSHTTLNIIGEFINTQDSNDNSTVNLVVKVKKNIQYFEWTAKNNIGSTILTRSEFIFISCYNKAPFLTLISPPPKSKYLL